MRTQNVFSFHKIYSFVRDSATIIVYERGKSSNCLADRFQYPGIFDGVQTVDV